MPNFGAPKLYIISDRGQTGGRPLLDVLGDALSGVRAVCRSADALPVAVQLREKDLPIAELTLLARDVRALTKKLGAELFINGRLDVALACGADGIHLPADGLAAEDVRTIAPHLRIARSTHSLDDVAAAARSGVDFVVLGPIFETPSKREFLRPLGVEYLSAAIVLGIPVVALGGITPQRAEDCRRAGAAGVACIRAVLAAANPGTASVAFLAHSGARK